MDRVTSPTNTFDGTFFAKSTEQRWVQVKFPMKIVELQVGVSCFAVMQRTLAQLQAQVDREHLGRALCILAYLWATNDTSSPRALVEIPAVAFAMSQQ